MPRPYRRRTSRIEPAMTVLVATGIWLLSAPVVAQSAEQRVNPKPSFRITPLVYAVQASSGQEVRFEFRVECFEKPVTLELKPVGLRQEPNGLILPDEEADVLGSIRLHVAEQVRLRPGESTVVGGAWQLPIEQSDFFSAGLLVTDRGAEQAGLGNGVQDETSACIRFVTRYMLRLEATSRRAAAAGSELPVIVSGALRSRDGRAVAVAELDAAGRGSTSVEVDGRILNDAGQPIGPAFAMYLPVRSRQPRAHRRIVPALAGRRVQIEAPILEPLFAGEYTLEFVLRHRGRDKSVATCPVCVEANDFPAQQTVVAQVVRNVVASPRQIELSTARGGARIRPLTFHNRSNQAVTLKLTALGPDAETPDWLLVRPTKFTLAAGRRRNVLVAVKGGVVVDGRHYGRLAAEVLPSKTAAGGRIEMPVALVTASEASPAVNATKATLTRGSRGDVIELPVENTGQCHAAITAKLVITDPLGREFQGKAGFGQWILPGEQKVLRFPTPPLPSGDYGLRIEVADDAGGVKDSVEQELTVGAGANIGRRVISTPVPTVRKRPGRAR